jgi:hypothetical protein
LEDQAARHTARLSRNALTVRADRRCERFLTQRCFGVGRATARDRLSALLDLVSVLQFEVLEVEEEFVVYDSNHSIDDGWLHKEE